MQMYSQGKTKAPRHPSGTEPKFNLSPHDVRDLYISNFASIHINNFAAQLVSLGVVFNWNNFFHSLFQGKSENKTWQPFFVLTDVVLHFIYTYI